MKSFTSVLIFVFALKIAFGSNDAGDGFKSLNDIIRALPAEQLESLKKGLISAASKHGAVQQMSTACAVKIGTLFTKDFRQLIGCKYEWR